MARAAASAITVFPSEDFLRFLVARKALSEERVEAFGKTGDTNTQSILSALLSEKVLPEEELYELLAQFLGVPFKRLPQNFKISQDLLHLIPEEAARRYQLLPLSKEKTTVEIGMLAPDDPLARDTLRFLAAREGWITNVVLITPTAYKNLFSQYRPFQTEVKAALTELEQTLGEGKREVSEEEEQQRREGAAQGELTGEAPVIKMVAVILRQAAEGHASDIHIEPGQGQMRVRFRVDGVLYTSIFLPMSIHPAIVSRFKILSNLKIDETRLPQDGRFRTAIDGKNIDFRIATLPTALGEKVAIRLLDPSTGPRSFEELGLSGQALHLINEASKRPYGVILVTGPTGSGKTTSLYTILQQVNRNEENIVTLEDPVEYFIEGVNQSQTHEEIGYSFATGLRHILRGDPNVIMVGEIRDAETAQLVVHAGLTGHLVFSTLHTNNAVGVIPRLIDLGVDAFLISPTLILVAAQRLVQQLCPFCKQPRELLPKEHDIVAAAFVMLPKEEQRELPQEKEWKLWEAPGCDHCHGRGTRGRIAVFETLRMTRELEGIILSSPSESKISDEARRQGMTTMFQDGIRKVLRGTISLQELLRVVEEEEKQSISV